MTRPATDEVIAALAADIRPVRRLRPPWLRCAMWLGLAVLVVAMLGVSHGLRPGLGLRFADPVFALRVTAAGATGLLAALAAFLVSLPDRSGRWALLPLPAVTLWLSTIGYGCLTTWIGLPAEGIGLHRVASCVATLTLVGVPLSLALLMMMRAARPLRSGPVALCGALAIAGITTIALSLFHVLDASILVLVWNLGTAVLFLGMAGLVSRRARARTPSIRRVMLRRDDGQAWLAYAAGEQRLEEIENEPAYSLAGRAAERLILGTVAVDAGGNAMSDLAQATKSAAGIDTYMGLGAEGSV